MDKETDDAIQRIIREEFASHTVITVAHRVSTVKNCDVIVVLEEGRIVEVKKQGERI